MTDEERDDDTLDALRRAFRGLPAPGPVRELDAEDADTRRVVTWMAAAWGEQSPASSVPPVAWQPRALPWHQRPAWRPLAAAAVVLALLGGGLLFADRAARREVTRPAPAPVAQAPVPETAVEPAPRAAPGIVAVADDHLELCSGPVRLLLFLDAPLPPSEDPR